MATGRDIAEFVSQITGQDYVGLYDESAAEEAKMMEQKEKFQNGFNDMMKRLDETNKNHQINFLD